MEDLQLVDRVLGRNGLRSGLDDVELTVEAVLRPLEVHRPRCAGLRRVVVLDDDRGLGQSDHLVVGDAVPVRFGRVDGDVPSGRPAARVVVDHAQRLRATLASQDRLVAGVQRRLEDVELVGIDGSLHHVLSEAVGAGDVHDVTEPRFGVECEHHPAAREVGSHHLHHAHRLGHVELPEAVLDPVVHAAIGVQAGVAASDGVDECVVARDVQVGLVGAGEACFREILRRRRRSHRQGHVVAVLRAECGVAGEDLGAEIVRQTGAVDDVSGSRRAGLEIGDVGRVQRIEQVVERAEDPGGLDRVPIGGRGDREPVGDANALRREFAVHLAE